MQSRDQEVCVKCANCGRRLTRPIYAGNLAFGSTCYRKVAGSKQRRARKPEAAPADPRQRDLFAEAA
jgi:hypothetical protein